MQTSVFFGICIVLPDARQHNANNWRIVTTSEFPAAPAASLLFQAPTFQEPVFQAAPPVASTPREPLAVQEPSADEPRKRRARKKRDSAGDNDEAPVEKIKEEPESAEAEVPADQELSERERIRQARRAKRESKRAAQAAAVENDTVTDTSDEEEDGSTRRRRRRRLRSDATEETNEVTALQGSTRLEAKKQRRKDSRREGRRRQTITESEFLARRESVDRKMVIRHHNGLDQIAVIEDNLLVEHYVARRTQQSMVGNIYLGRVQNVLPSMEAAFVDIGRGRNAVLYAGEVNWDAVGLEGRPRRIESALKSGDAVLVQVTKDPIGHKGARLTSQITLAGRYLVLIPGGSMMGISRKLPENERTRLKKILKKVVPAGSGVIVRTAAEGASEEQLMDDVTRLVKQWEDIEAKKDNTKAAPILLRGEPELAVRVVRDIFNEDFKQLVVEGRETYQTIKDYVQELSPELADRVEQWVGTGDVFSDYRVDEQLAKGMDRKVWLPSGGTLVIDRTEAMTVIDVNTGKFIGAGGTLEETVTKNNLEAAEEIVRQLRLRDIGGIVIIDFVDMVLEQNRDLVLRRLVEALGRDRTRHQVTEITSLGLVQMTRKRVGEGLVEAFSTTCTHCEGKGFIVHHDPVEHQVPGEPTPKQRKKKNTHIEEPRRIEEDSQSRERAREALSAIHKAAAKDESAEQDEATSSSQQETAKQQKPGHISETLTSPSESEAPVKEATEGTVVNKTEDPAPPPTAPSRKRGKQAVELTQLTDAEEPRPRRASRRRRVVSAEVVDPAAVPATATITLPDRMDRPAEVTTTPAKLDDIVLPSRDAEAPTPKKKRRRVISTGVIDA